MKTLHLCLLLVSVASVLGQPMAAQKSDAPAPKKPAATQKPADTPNATPQPKPEARPLVRRVAPPPVPPPPSLYRVEVYKGDVPSDPGMRPWQPPSRGQREAPRPR
jgi:hypothetical protein